MAVLSRGKAYILANITEKPSAFAEGLSGAADRDRTGDLLLGKETFYH